MFGTAPNPYVVFLSAFGLVVLTTALCRAITRHKALPYPILHVWLGFVLFSLPVDWPVADPHVHGTFTKHLTEFVVIVSLMGAGLTLQRRPGLYQWGNVWRLLAITMPLTIGTIALLGWAFAGLPLAAAVLLGAVLAPTDPVLASAVQVQEVHSKSEDEVRFSLTAEAGLNDGLAFPFTYLAILFAAGTPVAADWADWVLQDVIYRLSVGFLVGMAVGTLAAVLVFGRHGKGNRFLATSLEGVVALAFTLIAYGSTELLHGYGFVAVFIAAQRIRRWETDDKHHATLHKFIEEVEDIFMILALILFGGAIAHGLFDNLTLPLVGLAFATVLVVRPLFGWIAVSGPRAGNRQRLAIAVFGIKGIGSFYYLSKGLSEADFVVPEALWSVVGLVVLLSIVVHGLAARSVMNWVDRSRQTA